MLKIYCKKDLPKRSKRAFIKAYMDAQMPCTYYLDGDMKDELQCMNFRNRSYNDVKALLDGSFKTTTSLNKTVKLLMSLLDKREIKCLPCGDIKKLVFFGLKKNHWTFSINNPNDGNKDQYGENFKGNSLSLNDCLKIYRKV